MIVGLNLRKEILRNKCKVCGKNKLCDTIERGVRGCCLAMFSFWLHLLRTKGVQELVLRGLGFRVAE
jgi:hypothetical protein